AKRGADVFNLGYPSRIADVETLAAFVAQRLARWATGESFDVVTHSLGGIVLRVAVASGAIPADRVRRVVMLGPPNSGSELADTLPTVPVIGPVYRWLTGPAGDQLGTGLTGIPMRL